MKSRVVFLTRFAIEPEDELVAFTEGSQRETLFLDSTWLKNRLSLFARTALPSLQNQSDSDFEWLVGLDSRVDETFVATLSRLVGELGSVLLVAAPDTFHFSVSKFLSSSQDVSQIITARLDSDDAVHRDYVARIRRKSRPETALCFTHGVQVPWPSGQVIHRNDVSNPFLSFSTSTNENILSFGSHKRISDHVRLVNRWTRAPMYARLAHTGNTSKYRSTGWPVFWERRVLLALGLPPRKTEPKRLLAMAWSNLGRILARGNPRASTSLRRISGFSRRKASG